MHPRIAHIATRRIAARIAIGLAFTAAAITAAAAREPLACLAPSLPADAGTPLSEVGSLEFYVDEGDPLKGYSRRLSLLGSASDRLGRTQSHYRVGATAAAGATIVFAGETPVSFSLPALHKTYVSLMKNDEETAFMADAVPGIACYSVVPEAEGPARGRAPGAADPRGSP
jgi:hypothetical protein